MTGANFFKAKLDGAKNAEAAISIFMKEQNTKMKKAKTMKKMNRIKNRILLEVPLLKSPPPNTMKSKTTTIGKKIRLSPITEAMKSPRNLAANSLFWTVQS